MLFSNKSHSNNRSSILSLLDLTAPRSYSILALHECRAFQKYPACFSLPQSSILTRSALSPLLPNRHVLSVGGRGLAAAAGGPERGAGPEPAEPRLLDQPLPPGLLHVLLRLLHPLPRRAQDPAPAPTLHRHRRRPGPPADRYSPLPRDLLLGWMCFIGLYRMHNGLLYCAVQFKRSFLMLQMLNVLFYVALRTSFFNSYFSSVLTFCFVTTSHLGLIKYIYLIFNYIVKYASLVTSLVFWSAQSMLTMVPCSLSPREQCSSRCYIFQLQAGPAPCCQGHEPGTESLQHAG